MFGATLLKGYKLYKELGMGVFEENWQTLLIGNVVAFLVALLAIKFFISFVTKYGFRAFRLLPHHPLGRYSYRTAPRGQHLPRIVDGEAGPHRGGQRLPSTSL